VVRYANYRRGFGADYAIKGKKATMPPLLLEDFKKAL
jgi:hypothetical protein